MPDLRTRCRADPPWPRGAKPVTVHLKPDDYRALYELTMQRGISMSETLRELIREARQ